MQLMNFVFQNIHDNNNRLKVFESINRLLINRHMYKIIISYITRINSMPDRRHVRDPLL